MRRAVAFTGFLAIFPGAAFGQSTEAAAPKFEVADVHVSADTGSMLGGNMTGGLIRGGRYELHHATMLDLVRTAYNMDAEKVVGGPSWLEMDRFDVTAKAPADVTPEMAKLMLRGLLADRFRLVVHNDTKPVPAFALTAGKKPQLKESDGSGDPGCKFDVEGAGRGGRGGPAEGAAPLVPTIVYTCHNMTMAAFAEGMGKMPAAQQFIGSSIVADQTGLKGAWDFNFKYNVRGMAAAGAETVTLFDAMEKQLGLRLDPANVPMPVLVVDSVNQKPTANPPEAIKAFPALPVEFEVADVKPSDPDEPGPRLQIQPGGRINIQALPLKFLVEQLWNVTDEMVVNAPKFMETDRWDIVAKAPAAASLADAPPGQNAPPVDFDTLFQMMKTLLADRFKLVVHTEERPLSAYTLLAVKPKMKKADPASRTRCKEGPATMTKNDPRDANPVLGRLLTCQNMSMAQFADQLRFLANGYVHSPVLDATGLEGGWDFTLSFSTAGQLQGGGGRGGDAAPVSVGASGVTAPSDPNGAVSLPDAVEKQLGLKMEMQKRPVQVLVIDHIEQKPTDN